MEQNERRSLSILIASMIIFGTIGIVRKNIDLPSEVLAFSWGILGGTFLCAFLKARGRRFAWNSISKKNLVLLILTGTLIGINWILLFEAYNYTTVAIATLCYYMQPVIVLLVSPIVLKEKLTVRKIFCILTACFGMVLVSGVAGQVSGGSQPIMGIMLGLGAAALYASVVILNKLVQGVPVYEKTIIQLFSAAILLLPYMIPHGSLHAYHLSTLGIIMLLMAGIVHTGIAYAMYFGSVENLPAQTSALLSYIDPVTAVLLSALLLKEPLSLPGWIGTLLIIGAAMVSEIG